MHDGALFLGVDAGNSKTLAAVADRRGEVRGIGRGKCGNHQAFGLRPAIEQISLAVEQALTTARAERASIVSSFFALAGADLPDDFQMLRAAIGELDLASPYDVNNDTFAALRSGTNNPNAVVVVLGAGTNAAGRNDKGEEIRLPGLGWISGDWGGGGELGREAIRATARAWDGRGPATMLESMVFRVFDVNNGEELISRLYFSRSVNSGEVERALTHDLAREVFAAAEAGDAVAAELIVHSAEEVATTATTLLRRLRILDRPADVVLAGSIFKATGSLLRDTIEARLSVSAPRARIVRPEIQPVLGALFCAMDQCEIQVDRDVRERAAGSYGKLWMGTQEVMNS